MKNTLQIIATVDQPGLLEHMVEKLVIHRSEHGFRKQRTLDNHELSETSSAEAWVNGNVEIDSSDEHINMPFNTQFVFTCFKIKDKVYKLEWGSSLS